MWIQLGHTGAVAIQRHKPRREGGRIAVREQQYRVTPRQCPFLEALAPQRQLRIAQCIQQNRGKLHQTQARMSARRPRQIRLQVRERRLEMGLRYLVELDA
ncbi:hypothetical protein D3C71_1262340 [compost metagenome]